MLAKERQDAIFVMVSKDGAVTTGKLMEQFNVSIETVRRDLLVLEKAGRITRVHGGAVAAGQMQPVMALHQRNQARSEEKQELSETAMAFVSEGDIVAVDSGSTAILFAQALKEHFSNLTVVTHCRDVFELLCDHREFTVILCSGHYLRSERAFYGTLTLDTLQKLHVRKAFLCPSAVSLEFGICDYQPELCLVQKQLIAAAEKVFVLADSSKFEKKALLQLASMKKEYTYITDRKLPEEIRKLYAENGIQIIKGD